MDRNDRPIGGEFRIAPSLMDIGDGEALVAPAFASGRSAFRAVLRDAAHRGFSEVWLPEYLCESVPNAAYREGYRVRWYGLGADLHIDFETFSPGSDPESLVLLVDYFGMLDLSNDVAALHEKRAVVVVDKVQALFEERDFGADYWFSGFRKFLPIPEGAFAWSRSGRFAPPADESDVGALKILAGLVKDCASANSLRDESYLRLFELGEARLDAQEEIRCTGPLFGPLCSAVNAAKARDIRRANYRALAEALANKGMGTFLAAEFPDAAPLIVPIVVRDRDDVRKYLMSKRIYLPVHWPRKEQSGFAGFMARHELSLVVDQRYGPDDMARIAATIAASGARAARYDR